MFTFQVVDQDLEELVSGETVHFCEVDAAFPGVFDVLVCVLLVGAVRDRRCEADQVEVRVVGALSGQVEDGAGRLMYCLDFSEFFAENFGLFAEGSKIVSLVFDAVELVLSAGGRSAKAFVEVDLLSDGVEMQDEVLQRSSFFVNSGEPCGLACDEFVEFERRHPRNVRVGNHDLAGNGHSRGS